jgi:hypothetical protein
MFEPASPAHCEKVLKENMLYGMFFAVFSLLTDPRSSSKPL